MPLDSTFIPNGIDWADGLEGRPGTPTPDGAIVTLPSEVFFEEASDSPEIELGEQGTVQHKFRCDYTTALIFLPSLNRGAYFEDSFGNITRILSTRLVRQKGAPVTGGNATLTITSESISFDNPPDDFRFETIELNPALEKHPRYAFLPSQIRLAVNQALTAAQNAGQIEATNQISLIYTRTDTPPPGTVPYGGWLAVGDAAKELLAKRFIGEDTFYLPGFRIIWSRFFWLPPLTNPGGYIEDPITEGGLPSFFWSVDGTETGDSIISQYANINPQFYNSGISWLRMADTVDYQRTWFKLNHSWIGAPYAHWDADLYDNQPSPYPPPPKTFTLSS